MDGYFIFKGIDSRDMGILISSMPERVKPQKRIREIVIPGRQGSLIEDEGCYESYTLSMECGCRGADRLDEVITWLDGSGDLILCTEADKVYRATVHNAISIGDVIYLYNYFLIQFQVFPLKYSVNTFGDGLSLRAPQRIYNKGTVYAEPTITVYGSGDILLTINGEEFGLLDVSGHVTINSELMEVYRGNVNCNNQFQGWEFPRFVVGENKISWFGNVERVEVEPKWRWI